MRTQERKMVNIAFVLVSNTLETKILIFREVINALKMRIAKCCVFNTSTWHRKLDSQSQNKYQGSENVVGFRGNKNNYSDTKLSYIVETKTKTVLLKSGRILWKQKEIQQC